MGLILNLYQKMQEVWTSLNVYYEKIIKFYELFLKIKKGEYKFNFDRNILDLFYLLVHFDIKCFKNLSNFINPSPKNYEIIKKLIETEIVNLDRPSLIDNFNKYYDFPDLLLIEKDNLTISWLKIISINETVKMKIFESLYVQTNGFLEGKIKMYSIQKINITKDLLIRKRNMVDDDETKLSIIASANVITLFSKIALISMARENNYYITRLNILNINKNIIIKIKNYYL